MKHLSWNKLSIGAFAILFAIFVLAVRNTVYAADSGGLPNPVVDAALAAKKEKETTVRAGGCFGGVQAVFQHVKGVKDAISGYSGGSVALPTYEQVSTGET